MGVFLYLPHVNLGKTCCHISELILFALNCLNMKTPGTTSRSKTLCDGLACRAKHDEIMLFFIKNRKKKNVHLFVLVKKN